MCSHNPAQYVNSCLDHCVVLPPVETNFRSQIQLLLEYEDGLKQTSVTIHTENGSSQEQLRSC
jgi:hypothetical protein